MKKNQIVALVSCSIFSVLVILLLYVFSTIEKRIRKGGFKRSFLSEVFMASSIDLKVNSFYIAGSTGSKIYLANALAVDYLFSSNFSLRDSQHTRLKIVVDSVRSPNNFKVSIDSPYFFLTNGVEPMLLRGRLGEWAINSLDHDSTCFFVEAVPIDASSFAIKSLSTVKRGFVLGHTLKDSSYFNNNLLEKQVDGIFCVDGRLNFDRNTNQLIYLYFYRNEYIVMDAEMQLKYRAQTIDTFKHAQIQMRSLRNGTESMLSRPPFIVNGLSCTNANKLYVQSMILADNDDHETFMTASTIDVYDLEKGRYLGTFHIPNFHNQVMSSFQVVGDMIFAIVGNHLIRYNFIKPIPKA